MDLVGAAAIVTGGASGIGAAAVARFVEAGVRTVIIDRNPELGAKLATDIGAEFVEADVADEAGVAEAVARAEAIGDLRILVNAAGIGRAARTLDRDGSPLALDRFDRVIRVNLLGTFNCIRLAAAAMAKTAPVDASGSRGAIVNLASVAAFDGQIGQAAYAASKGGIVGMTLPVARDLSSVGIRVNTIAPGLIDTPIYGEGEAATAFKAKLGESVLFPPRLGTAEELASMIFELVTNDYVNGETVRVDGGIRMPPR